MKRYFKGFFKGIGIMLLLLVMILLMDYFFGETTGSGLIAWLISFALVSRLVYKEKLSKIWYLPAVVLGIIILPFFYGSRETRRLRTS